MPMPSSSSVSPLLSASRPSIKRWSLRRYKCPYAAPRRLGFPAWCLFGPRPLHGGPEKSCGGAELRAHCDLPPGLAGTEETGRSDCRLRWAQGLLDTLSKVRQTGAGQSGAGTPAFCPAARRVDDPWFEESVSEASGPADLSRPGAPKRLPEDVHPQLLRSAPAAPSRPFAEMEMESSSLEICSSFFSSFSVSSCLHGFCRFGCAGLRRRLSRLPSFASALWLGLWPLQAVPGLRASIHPHLHAYVHTFTHKYNAIRHDTTRCDTDTMRCETTRCMYVYVYISIHCIDNIMKLE